MDLPDIENIPETGAVFTIGRSRFADNVASHFFIRKDPVISVACGDEHSAVICQSGRLFVFGSNDWGQLGLGHKNHVSKPSCVKILKPDKVTHAACGRTHTLICTGGQKLFACGSDQEGQLGRGSNAVGDSSSSPVMVHDCGLAGPKVVQLCAGSQHSMALTADGSVLVWGSNLEGQLGLPGTSGLVNKPTKVQIPENIKQISAGYYHSAFLTESGFVYICGESESGKLGIDVKFSTQAAPKQIMLSKSATKIACGGHHTLILTEDGCIYCMGSNSNGQLGLGTNVTEVQTPNLLPLDVLKNEVISKISCGESHSAFLTNSGKIYTCGDGRHGKLGLEENENNVHELTFATRYQELFVTNVSCGGCHTILVGRRRDSGNRESETIQTDHSSQKKNPLPPLKVPVNRLPTGNHVEQAENENMEKSEKTDPSTDKIKDRVAINDQEAINNTATGGFIESKASPINNVAMKNIEKQESPKKFSDYLPKDDPPVENKLKSMENDNEEKEIDTSALEEIDKSARDEIDKSASEKFDKTVPEEILIRAPEEVLEKMDPAKNLESSDPSVILIENEKIEEASDEATRAEVRLEKPISPPTTDPPPKPPRQKSGSASTSSTTPSSPVKNFDSGVIVEIHEKMENELKEDTFSINSVDTQKTRSAKSKRSEAEEINQVDDILTEVERKKENGEEGRKEDLEIIDDGDDADDVQSPITRTAH
ncbi:X-linked retinitis pigmentosa GTPase regulator-like isoform X2 [Belonocnema kinseyi]|uniref:X-linked retinitis pigmentosa GTPase regulator-like isoform X2 n=1 Tax=Belonocnema kinseyi TaxID=2817044 RepID=UPI00143D72E2|nr:X-linked retinitis pigmentosa GTPase regulator-like isoform X2 [Belonocnema kinseyi]